MIEYKVELDKVSLVKLISSCMNPSGSFNPYKPNEHDNSFWTVDMGNDWKVKFHPKNKVQIKHRYNDNTAETALETWVAYRTGGLIL